MTTKSVLVLLVVMATTLAVASSRRHFFHSLHRYYFGRWRCDRCCDQCKDQIKEREDTVRNLCTTAGGFFCEFSKTCYYLIPTASLNGTFESYDEACNMNTESLQIPGNIIDVDEQEFETVGPPCMKEAGVYEQEFQDGLIGSFGNGTCRYVSYGEGGFTYEARPCSENTLGFALCEYDGFDC